MGEGRHERNGPGVVSLSPLAGRVKDREWCQSLELAQTTRSGAELGPARLWLGQLPHHSPPDLGVAGALLWVSLAGS